MGPVIGTFFGTTLTVGGVAAAITQILKVAEVSNIPVVQALLNLISKENPMTIRIFLVGLCFVLNVLSTWMVTKHFPVMDLATLEGTLISFFTATAAFHLVLKPTEAVPAA